MLLLCYLLSIASHNVAVVDTAQLEHSIGEGIADDEAAVAAAREHLNSLPRAVRWAHRLVVPSLTVVVFWGCVALPLHPVAVAAGSALYGWLVAKGFQSIRSTALRLNAAAFARAIVLVSVPAIAVWTVLHYYR
ncbi:MAG: hypothetical protein WC809_07295 [Sinimarinibacterium sp.]|jgi:hypothetical protein